MNCFKDPCVQYGHVVLPLRVSRCLVNSMGAVWPVHTMFLCGHVNRTVWGENKTSEGPQGIQLCGCTR